MNWQAGIAFGIVIGMLIERSFKWLELKTQELKVSAESQLESPDTKDPSPPF